MILFSSFGGIRGVRRKAPTPARPASGAGSRTDRGSEEKDDVPLAGGEWMSERAALERSRERAGGLRSKGIGGPQDRRDHGPGRGRVAEHVCGGELRVVAVRAVRSGPRRRRGCLGPTARVAVRRSRRLGDDRRRRDTGAGGTPAKADDGGDQERARQPSGDPTPLSLPWHALGRYARRADESIGVSGPPASSCPVRSCAGAA